MPLSNNKQNTLLQEVSGQTTTSGTYNSCYVALCTTTSTADTPGTEVTFGSTAGVGYHRQLINGANMNSPVKDTTSQTGKVIRYVTNKLPVMFYKADSDWGTIRSVAFYSSATGTGASYYVAYQNLDTPIAITTGSVANFDMGELKISITEDLPSTNE